MTDLDDLLGVTNTKQLLEHITLDAYARDIAVSSHMHRQHGLRKQVPDGFWLRTEPLDPNDAKAQSKRTRLSTSAHARDIGHNQWEVNVNQASFFDLPLHEQQSYIERALPLVTAVFNEPQISREVLIKISYLSFHGEGSGSMQPSRFEDAHPVMLKACGDEVDLALKQLRPTLNLNPDVTAVAQQMHSKRQAALRQSSSPDCWQVVGYQSRTEFEQNRAQIPPEHYRLNPYGHWEINHAAIAIEHMPVRIQNELYRDKATDIVAFAKQTYNSVDAHVSTHFTQYLEDHYPHAQSSDHLADIIARDLVSQVQDAQHLLGIEGEDTPPKTGSPVFSM